TSPGTSTGRVTITPAPPKTRAWPSCWGRASPGPTRCRRGRRETSSRPRGRSRWRRGRRAGMKGGAQVYNVELARGRWLVPAICAGILFLAAGPAKGQGSMGMHWGIAGGAAFPYEDAKDIYSTGYQGSLLYTVNAPIVGLRFETFYSRM